MRNGLAFGLGILTGAGAMAVAANTILKQHYAQKADEEISSCREAFTTEAVKLRKEMNDKKAAEKKEAAVEAVKTYSPEQEKAKEAEKILRNEPVPDRKKIPEGWKRPYVIDPAIFDDIHNQNHRIGLNYYPKDGVITHAENDEVISLDDLDRMVGRESLVHFGENEEDPDRVCVRNENWKVDYEICIRSQSWADILKEKPWLKK